MIIQGYAFSYYVKQMFDCFLLILLQKPYPPMRDNLKCAKLKNPGEKNHLMFY